MRKHTHLFARAGLALFVLGTILLMGLTPALAQNPVPDAVNLTHEGEIDDPYTYDAADPEPYLCGTYRMLDGSLLVWTGVEWVEYGTGLPHVVTPSLTQTSAVQTQATPALTDRQIASVAKAAGFTGSNQVTATAVCLAESGGIPDDISSTHDYGLWQIHASAWPELMTAKVMASGSWKDPAVNAGFAYHIYKIQGWKAWAAYNNGRYKKFLTRAQAAVSGATRYDQTDKRIIKTGTWETFTKDAAYKGSYVRSSSAGASATITFTGTRLDYVGMKGITLGKVDIYLDGLRVASIDLHASVATYQVVVWSSGVLKAGTHRVKLVRSSASAAGRFITLDAVDIWE